VSFVELIVVFELL